MWRWRSAVWHVLHVIYLASVKRCRSYRLSWRRPIDRSGVLRCSLITRTPMSENSSVLSPASTSWAGQNILISSRLRGTHCTTLHLNYTHNTARVMCSQHSTEYTGPRARASAALPTRGPPTLKRISRRRCRASPGWSPDSTENARKPLRTRAVHAA